MTYPNVLVLDYMKRTNRVTPEIQMRAEQYIAQGYQLMLTYELPEGGFSLFGHPPADLMLTAYGLMAFSDMSQVSYVDPALIERTAQWLLRSQRSDGSWPAQGTKGGDELSLTAYVTWALIEAGFGDTPEVSRGLAYLHKYLGLRRDPYVLALAANALVAGAPGDTFTDQVLSALEGRRSAEDDGVFWDSASTSLMGGHGHMARIETTALAASAMLQADAYPETAKRAVDYLAAHRDSYGTWGSTQATILALRALLLSTLLSGEGEGDAEIRISFNGQEADPIWITEENADVVHLVSFAEGAQPGENILLLEKEGQRPLLYQAIAEYYLPWEELPEESTEREAISIQVTYGRTELSVNETVSVRARIRLQASGVVRMAVVDLGVPPGFSVLTEDLDRLVEGGDIARYEPRAQKMILYLENFSSEQPLEFTWRLRAKYPLKVQVPLSLAYDYYAPDTQGMQRPQAITVRE